MKQPHKPYAPSKPTPPSKTLKDPYRIEIDKHNTISLTQLRKKVPTNISDNNLFISVEEDGDYYSRDTWTNVYLTYYMDIPNPNYDRQMEDYEKNLKRYQKKCEQYKPKLAAYIEEKKKYDEWAAVDLAESRKRAQEREIAELKKRLAKLEKKK